MSSRNWQFRLDDIVESLELISEYVNGLDHSSWKEDRKTIDAVIRNIEIIGEAATHVPEDIQKQNKDIPWYQMKGMRNILIHEYFGVDLVVKRPRSTIGTDVWFLLVMSPGSPCSFEN